MLGGLFSLLCPPPSGPEFAERIKQNEAGNPKFNFLNPSDPYHAYYVHKIGEIKEGVAVQESTQQKVGYTQTLALCEHYLCTYIPTCVCEPVEAIL